MPLREISLPAPARWVAYTVALLALGALTVYLTPGIYGAPIRFTVAGIVVAAAGGILAANTWVKPRLGVPTTALAIVATWAVLGPLLPLLTGACGDAGACTAPQIASWVVSGALWGTLSVIVAALALVVRAGARLSVTVLRRARSFVIRAPKTDPATRDRAAKSTAKNRSESTAKSTGSEARKNSSGKEKSS